MHIYDEVVSLQFARDGEDFRGRRDKIREIVLFRCKYKLNHFYVIGTKS